MKGALNRFGMVALVATLVSATTFADVCVWDGSTYPGSYGCSNESCGYGCGDGYDYRNNWACKSSQSTGACCICSWTTWTCDCAFGTGTGSASSRTSGFGLCPTYTPGQQQQPMSCIGTEP